MHFPDEVLRAAVEDKLGVFEPTPQDLLGLLGLSHVMSFSSQDQGITDLSGLEFAINLRVLNLRLNMIDDLSPLAGLTELVRVNLSQNAIDDLSPLADLVNLEDLNVHANQIEDLSALADLTGLCDLNLRTNRITDLSPLSGLAALEWLDLFENQITDISPLDGLRNLRSLDLRSNDTLSEEAYCDDLQTILSLNPGLDLSYTTRLHTPTGVSVSMGGYPNEVRIRWDAVCNGPDVTSHYRVSRNTSTQEAKMPITPWQTSAHFEDRTAQIGTTYYYLDTNGVERVWRERQRLCCT